jgi:hypothetical protein
MCGFHILTLGRPKKETRLPVFEGSTGDEKLRKNNDPSGRTSRVFARA